MKTKKTKEAVSLIVLVLTIVIMIILAGVIVINLNNTGIIDRAKNAVSETNLKTITELANIAWGEAYIEGTYAQKTDVEYLKAAIKTKLLGKGITEQELDKYTFIVTTGGVEVAVNTGIIEPEEPTIDVALNPSGTIPEGATYYRYEELPISDYSCAYYINPSTIANEATAFEAGTSFPDTIEKGDIYIYNGYVYAYELAAASWEYGENYWYVTNGFHEVPATGWGVVWMNQDVPVNAPILESINSEPIETLESTFVNCEFDSVPVIPNSVKNMNYTFVNCSTLEGTITINATPTSYEGCFWGIDVRNIEIIGDCENKEKLYGD